MPFLYVVFVSCLPTATSGCRGLSFVTSLAPPAITSVAYQEGGSPRAPAWGSLFLPRVVRSTSTLATRSYSRGCHPGTPSSLASRQASGSLRPLLSGAVKSHPTVVCCVLFDVPLPMRARPIVPRRPFSVVKVVPFDKLTVSTLTTGPACRTGRAPYGLLVSFPKFPCSTTSACSTAST